MKGLNRDRLRIAFVVYGAMNRKDWRTISIKDLDVDSEETAHQLIPMLNSSTAGEQETAAEYGKRLIEECSRALSVVLPFEDNELEFLDLILDNGKIEPALLTTDKELQGRIQRQPLLEWKTLNVRKHKGIL